MFRFLRAVGTTIFVYFGVLLSTALLFTVTVLPVALLERLAGRRCPEIGPRILGRLIWLSSAVLRTFTVVVLDGRERVPDGTAVIICNHHSIADLYLLLHLFPRVCYIARRSLFRVPFVGWSAFLLGEIPLDERDPGVTLQAAMEVMRSGRSVAVFPEGTRYPEGSIGPFRRGAFLIAQATTHRVQPVVVAGTGIAWPRGRWYFPRLSPMGMRVLPVQEIGPDLSRKELTRRIEEIRALMLVERSRLARELGLPGNHGPTPPSR